MLPQIVARSLELPQGKRQIIALAGPPASGKSTLADDLAKGLALAGREAAVVPMDGFHLDNAILDARGLLPRKGAPETFDLRGFAALLELIVAGGEVFFPLFDRDRELAICAAGCVPESCDLVIVEGNYLLLDAPGWRDLAQIWDLSVFLDMGEETLACRLRDRWLGQGFSAAQAIERAEENDLPNARFVQARRIEADLVFPRLIARRAPLFALFSRRVWRALRHSWSVVA